MFVASLMLVLCGEKLGDGTSASCEGEASDAPEPEEHKYSDLIDKVMHSKVMEELKALPAEIRESLILHVERQSLVVAGVLVAIGALVLLLGCLWIHWCHTEYVEYVPISQLEEAEQRLHLSKHSHGHHGRHKHSHVPRPKPEFEQDGTHVVHRKTGIANGGQS
ncbi:hypothetical protein BaRGS_00022017 [Batillaria attramentaria]|uniref:Uncharacterized protein n=1 Tax=Batillaria attramentaria TaxID=370345 RepID=A0ABD0KI39_9CAEN